MAYFIFKGISSVMYGLKILSMPYITSAAQNYEEMAVPGRAEPLTVLRDSYNTISKKITFEFTKNAENAIAREVISWLRGKGRLTLSDEPDKYYNAVSVRAISSNKINSIYRSMTVEFICSPFIYSVNETAENITGATSYVRITNEGTFYSEPLIQFKMNPAPDILMGDVNLDGRVDAADAALVLNEYASVMAGTGSILTERQKQAADVNGDGRIDAMDAAIILQIYADSMTGGGDQTSYDVFIFVNGETLRISVPAVVVNGGHTVTADSSLQLIYYTDNDNKKINILHRSYGNLPRLRAGDNYIMHRGNIESMTIQQRARWI